MKNEIARCTSLGLVLFLTVITVAILPTTASAQDQTFMLVPVVPGTSQDAHHRGWIDVIS